MDFDTSFYTNFRDKHPSKIKVFSLWIGLLMLLSTVLTGQEQMHFSRLTTSFTNCIHQDSDGFIWVGTQDGLLRYSNYAFEVFRNQGDDPFSLPNNYIRDIVEDKNNNLWFGTFGGGLVMWDRSLERFYAYPLDTDSESIHSLEFFQDSILLIGSDNGLFQFNINKKEVIQPTTIKTKSTNFINDIYVSAEGKIFLGTNKGFMEYDMELGSIDPIMNSENLIVHTLEAQAHRIFIGTDKGLFIYNKRKNTFDSQIPNKSISSILLVSNTKWYIGTNSGIGVCIDGENYKWYGKGDDDTHGLQSDLIHSLEFVDGETIWAGTRIGVHQFSSKPPEFQNLQKLYNIDGCSTTALGMTEDKNKDIWICSREGLMYIDVDGDIENWKSTCYNTSNTPKMLDDYTINITRDSEDALWLAYRKNGFSKLLEVNGNWIWQNFPKAASELNGEGVNQVFQDYSGRIWLATRGRGLALFDPITENLEFIDEEDGLSHNYIFRIYQEKAGFLWISTANGGLCNMQIETKAFLCKEADVKNPSSISVNMVLSTNTKSDGTLLVCTTEGLNILSSDGNFKKINKFDGLPNNVVYAALEDDNGKIWISTNEGISRLNLNQEIPEVINYNMSHGLSSTEFNQHAFLEHSSGLFLFGGIEGITVFNPTNIESNQIDRNLAFTDLQLFNKSVPIASENSSEFSIPKSINKLDEIRLGYAQNSVAFEYAALGISNSKNTSYQYRLEGLEPSWIKANERNYAAYPKLPPGDYNFKIRLTDLSGNVISKEKSIKVSLATPPWKTWWAYLVYLFLLLTSLWLILKDQKQRTLAIVKAREDERGVFRKRMARDFHDEAGNRITRISLITESVTRKSKEPEVVNTLNKLQDNIQELRQGMTDFIWILDPGKDTLSATLRRFLDFANETFEFTDIHFKMDPIDDKLTNISMTSNIRRHFILIMKEATTNILKHANPNVVEFNHSKEGNTWNFTISDDGKGFDIDELKRVNGIDNMRVRAEKIDGKLTVKTAKGKGSSINLQIDL